jgi:hypothetical protein
MFVEHFLYSGALAILAGMVFYHATKRDPSWIIIVCALAPDVDYIASPLLRRLGIGLLLNGHPILHGTFHNIAFMVLFGIAMAFVLHPLGLRFLDSLVFAVTGFGAHLVEDALVFKIGYASLWPLSSERTGLGLLTNMINEETYIRDFFGLANTDVFVIGLLLLFSAFVIRSYAEQSFSWLRWYMPQEIYLIVSGQKPGAGTGTGDHRAQ